MPKNNIIRFGYDLKMQSEVEEAEILIYGYITQYKWDEDSPDMTAKDFDKLLKDAKAQGAKKLRIRINSGGGSVWQAVAMRAMLLNSQFEEISVDIEGICASAATLFVCLPDVHVRIAEGSEFMIHNPSTYAGGTAADFEAMAERMRKMEDEDHIMYAKRTGQSEEQIKKWMDAETWFTAREAVEHGFADELVEAGEIAACVQPDVMEAMSGMYKQIPKAVVQMTAKPTVSYNEPTAAAGALTENKNPNEGGKNNMEITEVTMEMLRDGNRAVYDQIMQSGANKERERINDIDDLTPAGYENMAQEAKANGTDAVTYCKMIAKAQREKAKSFIEKRREETAPAQNVKGGSSDDSANEADEMKKFAAEMKGYAENGENGYRDLGNGMY